MSLVRNMLNEKTPAFAYLAYVAFSTVFNL